jgi:tripartite ATP-independent transporter DctM subunit
MDALILLGSLFALIALGVPIAYALGIASLIGAIWFDIPLEAVMLKISDGISKFSLLAIPFFVLAGAIMAEGGMARRLIALASIFVGFIRGGLALVNIVASSLFGCISGSSVADTSSIGSVMIPQMERAGYPRVFATNVTICGSVQAILIPPSHNAVIYSLAVGGTVSIGHLLIAGFFPGLLLGLSLSILVVFTAYREGYPKGEVIPFRQAIKIAIEAFWGLMTMLIITGGILGGIFTATEAAAVACAWAFFVTMFIYRDYKWRDLHLLVHRTMKTVGMVMILIAFASGFGYMMALMQLPAKVTQFFLTISDNKYVILFLINMLLLFLGTLMDMAPLLLICTPILLPVVQTFGVDPVHFGMIMLVNLGIGLVTPPVGSVLFVGCAVAKLTIEQVTRKIWPFYIAMFVVLMLVTYVPAISLWLPNLMLAKLP